MESPGLPRPSAASGSDGRKGGWRQAAFELKGTMAPLTVMRLQTVDLMLIERQLRRKIAERPQMFHYAPVLLDLALLEEPGALSVSALVSLMRGHKLVPVGAINAPEAFGPTLAAAGLGLLPSTTATAKLRVPDADGREAEGREAELERAEEHRKRRATPPARAAEPVTPPPASPPIVAAPPPPTPLPAAVAPAAHGGPMVITKPVRSGQVVYAQNNDLVVLAPVNPGAQVMADGHVHIYAPLRGRAVAGAQGLPGARIFCQKLEAELVAIADAYVMADEIPVKLRGKAVQVFLEGRECRVTAL
jgi:septum site-determining protein MinC